MVPWHITEDWHSFSELEAESKHLRREDFPPARPHRESSGSGNGDNSRVSSGRKRGACPEVNGSLGRALHPKLLAASRVSATFAGTSSPDPNAGKTFSCEDP